jgi:pyruvate/oxaloacetate carboxyltransferase
VVTPQTQIAPAQATPEVVAPSVSPRAQLQAPTSGILTIELALIQIDLSSAHPSTQSISLPLAGQRHECKHGDTYIVTVDDAIMFSNTMSEFVKYKEDAQFTVSVS